jgi:hypothetical protein
MWMCVFALVGLSEGEDFRRSGIRLTEDSRPGNQVSPNQLAVWITSRLKDIYESTAHF